MNEPAQVMPIKPEWMPEFLEHLALSVNRYHGEDLKTIADYIRSTLKTSGKP